MIDLTKIKVNDEVFCIREYVTTGPQGSSTILQEGRSYRVTLVVLDGQDTYGKCSGVVLDCNCAHPYVWDADRFILTAKPKKEKK